MIKSSPESKFFEAQFKIIKREDGTVFLKIEIDSNNQQIISKIFFKDINNKLVNLTKFLPSGWKVIFSDNQEFSTSIHDKTIKIGDLSKNGSILGLLHEFGHAWIAENMPEVANYSQILEDYTKDVTNRSLTLEDLQKSGKNPDDYVEITIYDPYGKGTGGVDNDEVWFSMLVPKEIIKNYGKAWADCERKAWAYAVKILRKLRREGIAIENGLSDVEQLFKEIYSCLKTYDQYFEKEFKDPSSYFTKDKYL